MVTENDLLNLDKDRKYYCTATSSSVTIFGTGRMRILYGGTYAQP